MDSTKSKISAGKIFFIVLFCAACFYYIYASYLLKHSNILVYAAQLNFWYIALGTLCYAVPHFSRAFVFRTIYPQISFIKAFFILSSQYFLIFLFSFKIGEFSLIPILKKHENLSYSQALSIMVFLQIFDTAAISLHITYSLLCAGADFTSSSASSLLKGIVFTAIAVLSGLILIIAVMKKNTSIKSIVDMFPPKKMLLCYVALAAGWTFPFLCIQLTYKAAGMDIEYYKAVIGVVVAYSSFLSIVKPPMGAGLYTIGWTETFSFLGVPEKFAYFVGIIEYIQTIGVVIVLGLAGFIFLTVLKPKISHTSE